MASINKVTLIGRLGADPNLQYTPGGTAVCKLSVATDGPNKSTEWHKVVVWGKQAESCAKYLSKGSGVCVEGRLQTRDWEDRNGTKHYMTEIVAMWVQFIKARSQANQRTDQNAAVNG